MRPWILARPILSYCAITVTLSWGYWWTLVALGQRVEAGSAATHLPGLAGPGIAALVVTGVLGGRNGLRELLGRLTRFPPPRWQAALLALSPLVLGAAVFGALAALGRPVPPLASFARYPGLPENWHIAPVILAVLVLNGFGEEIGWRGFLTEKLFERHDRFKATLLVAGLWAVWHLPVFWLSANMAALAGPMRIGWLVGLLCGAFVLAHVYTLCGHSILCVAVWHTAYNMMVGTAAGRGVPAACVSTAVMVWGAAVALRWWRTRPRPAPDLSIDRSGGSI